MYQVYRSWLDEFDHQAAIKRQLPRRERVAKSHGRFGFLGRRRTRRAVPKAALGAGSYRQAQQCS